MSEPMGLSFVEADQAFRESNQASPVGTLGWAWLHPACIGLVGARATSLRVTPRARIDVEGRAALAASSRAE